MQYCESAKRRGVTSKRNRSIVLRISRRSHGEQELSSYVSVCYRSTMKVWRRTMQKMLQTLTREFDDRSTSGRQSCGMSFVAVSGPRREFNVGDNVNINVRLFSADVVK